MDNIIYQDEFNLIPIERNEPCPECGSKENVYGEKNRDIEDPRAYQELWYCYRCSYEWVGGIGRDDGAGDRSDG